MGILLLFAGCSRPDSTGATKSNRVMHIMFDEDRELLCAVFDKQNVNMDSLYLDHINDIDVDKAGMIYLAGEKWNHQQVHKFSAEGDYLGSIGQLGDDPGSFRKAVRVQIVASGLWVSDPELNRMSSFNASTGELQEVIDLDSLVARSDISNLGERMEFAPVGLIGQNRLLITTAGERIPAYQPEWKIQYVSISTHENNSPEITHLFDGMAKRYMVGDYAGVLPRSRYPSTKSI